MTTGPAERAATVAGIGDLLASLVLLALGLAGFVPAFGDWSFAPAVVGGLVVGGALGWLGARRGWWSVLVGAATVAGYLLLAGPLAYRSLALGGLVPSPGSLRESAVGAVTAWKGFVTAATPLSAFPELVVVPLILALLGAVLASSWALRLRRHGWALLPSLVVFVATMLLGTAQAWHPVERAAAFGVLAAGWLTWRRVGGAGDDDADGSAVPEDRRALVRRRLRRSAAMLALVAVLATTAGLSFAHADRRYAVRQDVVPPLDLRQYASPLESFRSFVDARKDDELFEATGLPAGARLRLAVLDVYRGTVMDVAGGDRDSAATSGVFERGAVHFLDAATTAPAGEVATVTVASVGYRGPWVPTPGVPRALSFGGDRAGELARGLYVNPVTGTSVSTGGVLPGDSYTVEVVLPPELAPDEVGTRVIEPVEQSDPYPLDAAGSVARSIVGEATAAGDQLRALRAGLRAGQFSDGLDNQPASRPGHGADRITTLLTGDAMVGDDEQYAVAAALMARSLGYSSRVVMGFYPDPTGAAVAAGGVVSITGSDVHAWTEIEVRGVGWVAYDVTPDEDKPPQEQDPRVNAAPQPQVLQEPDAAQPPPDVPQPPIADELRGDRDEPGESSVPWGVIAVGAGGAGIVLGPLVLVLAAKARRRRRRRTAVRAVDRVSGGWHEVTDAAVDLGALLPVGATRRETAVDLDRRFAGAAAPTVLAARADEVVFGGGEPTAEEIDDFWRGVEGLVGDLRKGSSLWARLRAPISPRSLHWQPHLPRLLGRARALRRDGASR